MTTDKQLTTAQPITLEEKARQLSEALGTDLATTRRYLRTLETRVRYNSRPEVRAKRREYARTRQEEMRVFRQIKRDAGL
jgi:hypothetical protein